MVAAAVTTATIIPSTVRGGMPGGRPKTKPKAASPIPATVPSPIPPRRAPTRMHTRRTSNSIHTISATLIYLHSKPFAAARSVRLEKGFNFRGRPWFQKRQHQQDPRLLRIELIGSDKTKFVI